MTEDLVLELATENDSNLLFEEYRKTGDENLRNKIVEDNLPLVKSIARKFSGKGIDEDDLFQVGAMALVNAVERFEPKRGFNFRSFATPTIIGEIKRYFRDKGWLMNMPRRIQELALKVDKVREEYYVKNGRQPKISEVAEMLSASEEEILEAMESRTNYRAYSLSQVMEDLSEEAGTSNLSIEKFTGINEKGYEEFESVEFVKSLMKKLSERERVILKEGLLRGKSQAELAKNLGLSQMTVSRIYGDIREKFRKEYNR